MPKPFFCVPILTSIDLGSEKLVQGLFMTFRGSKYLYLHGLIPEFKKYIKKNLFYDCASKEMNITQAEFIIQFSSVAQSCSTLCDPLNCSMPGLPVHHQLPEFTQIQDRKSVV